MPDQTYPSGKGRVPEATDGLSVAVSSHRLMMACQGRNGDPEPQEEPIAELTCFVCGAPMKPPQRPVDMPSIRQDNRNRPRVVYVPVYHCGLDCFDLLRAAAKRRMQEFQSLRARARNNEHGIRTHLQCRATITAVAMGRLPSNRRSR